MRPSGRKSRQPGNISLITKVGSGSLRRVYAGLADVYTPKRRPRKLGRGSPGREPLSEGRKAPREAITVATSEARSSRLLASLETGSWARVSRTLSFTRGFVLCLAHALTLVYVVQKSFWRPPPSRARGDRPIYRVRYYICSIVIVHSSSSGTPWLVGLDRTPLCETLSLWAP